MFGFRMRDGCDDVGVRGETWTSRGKAYLSLGVFDIVGVSGVGLVERLGGGVLRRLLLVTC